MITNKGKVFCAGANLAEQTSLAPNERRPFRLDELFSLIQNLPSRSLAALRVTASPVALV